MAAIVVNTCGDCCDTASTPVVTTDVSTDSLLPLICKPIPESVIAFYHLLLNELFIYLTKV
jgi:hypothetical protein